MNEHSDSSPAWIFHFQRCYFFSIVREVLIVLQFLSSLWWNSFNLCLLGVFHINIRYKNVTQIKNKNVMVNAEKGICTSVRSTDRCKFNHQVALFSQVIPGTIEKHLTWAICESFAKRSTAHTRVCFLCDKLNSRYTNPPNVTLEMETHLSSPGNNKVKHVSSDASVRNCTQLKVNAFNEIKC